MLRCPPPAAAPHPQSAPIAGCSTRSRCEPRITRWRQPRSAARRALHLCSPSRRPARGAGSHEGRPRAVRSRPERAVRRVCGRLHSRAPHGLGQRALPGGRRGPAGAARSRVGVHPLPFPPPPPARCRSLCPPALCPCPRPPHSPARHPRLQTRSTEAALGSLFAALAASTEQPPAAVVVLVGEGAKAVQARLGELAAAAPASLQLPSAVQEVSACVRMGLAGGCSRKIWGVDAAGLLCAASLLEAAPHVRCTASAACCYPVQGTDHPVLAALQRSADSLRVKVRSCGGA